MSRVNDQRLAAALDALTRPQPRPSAQGLASVLSEEERAVLIAILDQVTIPGSIARTVGRLQDRIEGKIP